MAFPFLKLAITVFRIFSRPLTAVTIRLIKARGQQSIFRGMFIASGQLAHRFEARLSRYVVGDAQGLFTSEGSGGQGGYKVRVRPLNPDYAFTKGVEWVAELVFFYGFLLGALYWTLRKAAVESAAKKAREAGWQQEAADSQRRLGEQEAEAERNRQIRAQNAEEMERLQEEYDRLRAIVDKLDAEEEAELQVERQRRAALSDVGNTPLV